MMENIVHATIYRYDFRGSWRARLWISASRIHANFGKLELSGGGRGNRSMYIVGDIFSDVYDARNWVEGSAEARRLCSRLGEVQGRAVPTFLYVCWGGCTCTRRMCYWLDASSRFGWNLRGARLFLFPCFFRSSLNVFSATVESFIKYFFFYSLCFADSQSDV